MEFLNDLRFINPDQEILQEWLEQDLRGQVPTNAVSHDAQSPQATNVAWEGMLDMEFHSTPQA